MTDQLEQVVAPRAQFVTAIDDNVAAGDVIGVAPEVAQSLVDQGWSRPRAVKARKRAAKKPATKKAPPAPTPEPTDTPKEADS